MSKLPNVKCNSIRSSEKGGSALPNLFCLRRAPGCKPVLCWHGAAMPEQLRRVAEHRMPACRKWGEALRREAQEGVFLGLPRWLMGEGSGVLAVRHEKDTWWLVTSRSRRHPWGGGRARRISPATPKAHGRVLQAVLPNKGNLILLFF